MTKKKTDETKPPADAPAEVPAPDVKAKAEPKPAAKPEPEAKSVAEWGRLTKTDPALVAGALRRSRLPADHVATEREFHKIMENFLKKPAFGGR